MTLGIPFIYSSPSLDSFAFLLMKKLIAYQLVALILVSLAAALWQGFPSGLSAFLGGASYALPTLIAASVLRLIGTHPVFSAVGFMYVEGVKVLLSLLLMAMVFLIYPTVQWWAFLVGLLVVSHCIFFVFGEVVNHGNRTTG